LAPSTRGKSNCFDIQIAGTTVTMLQLIMISYKLINCQQAFIGLFEAISKEMVELDLVSRIPVLMWELIEVICSIAGFDFMELQEQLFENDPEYSGWKYLQKCYPKEYSIR